MPHTTDDAGVLRCAMALAAGLTALLTGSFQAVAAESPPVTAVSSAATGAADWAQTLRQQATRLSYSEQLAQEFVDLTRGWNDGEWRRELAQPGVAQAANERMAEREERLVRALARTIRQHIRCAEGQFELAGVIQTRTADCVGLSQVLYLLGHALGLSVTAIDVTQLASSAGDLPPGSSHVACTVNLVDGRTMMVDIATADAPLVSQPFRWTEAFVASGDYWELQKRAPVSDLHRRVRRLDRNGLTACLHDNRGDVHNQLGQYSPAITEFNAAIELDPKCVGAYNNRGIAWHRLGKVPQALADYAVAVNLDPKCGEAYYNRGNVYGTLGDFREAIADYTRAVQLNEKYTWAYTNRGNAYFHLTRFTEAMADHTQAIKLDPTLAEAYSNRGSVYKSLGRFSEAVADHTKAITLNPGCSAFYINRAIAYCRLGQVEQGKRDLRKAVELDSASKQRASDLGRHFKLNLGF